MKMLCGVNQYTTVETEQLIELVREHPFLFDPPLPAYRDAQLVANTWQSIDDVLG